MAGSYTAAVVGGKVIRTPVLEHVRYRMKHKGSVNLSMWCPTGFSFFGVV